MTCTTSTVAVSRCSARFRADHTVMDTGHHRLPIGTISGASANDRNRRILVVAARSGEGPVQTEFADLRVRHEINARFGR